MVRADVISIQSNHCHLFMNGESMSSIAARNLPEETHRVLRVGAALAGRSTEAEVRAILESVARPEGRVRLGSLLAEIGQQAGGFDLVTEPLKLAGDVALEGKAIAPADGYIAAIAVTHG
jgi:antitoxin FitA